VRTYSPGSTFKTLQALVGLHEGVVTPIQRLAAMAHFMVAAAAGPCVASIGLWISVSGHYPFPDNTYFANVMQRVINNPKYPSIFDSALSHWDHYMYAFGLGHKLGVDVPSEKPGNHPNPEVF
jgi:penicillin-binding protein 2